MSGGRPTLLLDRTLCGNDVVMMRFERPEDFVFIPGQWLRLTVETVEGKQTKTFTIASARDDDWLEIATRISGSTFKQALERLRPGERVGLTGPGGRMSLPDGIRRAAFLVGGVGVTPARSMLRDATRRGRAFEDVLVLYGNRDARCAPYLDELEAMKAAGVRVVPVYERADADWSGERGFITADMVRRYLDPGDGRPFIVAGPPAMVAAIKGVLDELEVAEERRRVEWFGAPPK